MNSRVTRRRLLAGGAVATLTGLAGCSGVTPFVGRRTESDRSLPLDGVSTLAVDADVGDVRVVGERRDDAAVRVVKEASSVTVDLSDLTLDATRDGDRLRLRTRYRGEVPWFGGRPSMDLSLRVPRSLAVDRVRSDVGDVDVRGVRGALAAETDTGDVLVRDVSGTVGATADTGDVTVSGSDVVGDVATSTGDLDLSVPAVDGATRFASETGDIVVVCSPDVDARLTARTNTGDVSVSGLSLGDAAREESVVTGRLGDGGPDLTVETNTGDVRISSSGDR